VHGVRTIAAVLLALGAAWSFAVANVAQMRAARRADAREGVHAGLLLKLLRDPAWLRGLAASAVGYGCQAVALYLAPILLVQPLIVAELLFALPMAASLAGVRLHRREWIGAVLVAAGITAFVLVGRPTGARTHLAGSTWLITTGSVAVVVAALVVVAERGRRRPMTRASILALAASTCFGLLSVLTKVVGHQFDNHGVGTLLLPQPWLLAVAAITGLLLAQTAFRIAPLSVSLPIIDVGEPLVASLIAALALGETIGVGIGTAVGVGIAGAAVMAGISLLDTSPVVKAAQADLDSKAARARIATAPVPCEGQ
jgi:drug/metabolite transporter (DMT)-like permease